MAFAQDNTGTKGIGYIIIEHRDNQMIKNESKKRRISCYALILNIVILFCLPRYSKAATFPEPLQKKTFSVYIENDIFAGDDSQYTNGLKLTWSRFGLDHLPQDAWTHRWLYPLARWLGIKDSPDTKKALTFSIGQNIYTPEDIEQKDVIEDDRPYAGITYTEFGFHQRIDNKMDTLEFYAGIVGPHSYAEQVQSAVHSALNTTDPKGWDNQLNDEPVIGIIYEFKKKFAEKNIGRGLGYDLVFNTGGGLGNAITYYNLGLLWRFGWNLPDDFGTYPIRPATCFNAALNEKTTNKKGRLFKGIHYFLSINGRAVIRDIFLDGNTFSSSHSVDKKPLVADIMTGFGLIIGNIKASMAYVYQTRSFTEQKDPQVYGSVNITYIY